MLRRTLKKIVTTLPLRFRRKLSQLLLFDQHSYQLPERELLASKYIRGCGLEIGALHMPMPVPLHVQVTYVDRMSVKKLRKQYPELNDLNLVEPDIIDDGELLSTVASNSQEFVIAAHMLEHTEDPIGTLKNWARVLKPGGILFLAVPNRDYTFDKDRELTNFEHLVTDHMYGAEASREKHFDEWVQHVSKLSGAAASAEKKRLLEMNYSIHFHVWDEASFMHFLSQGLSRYVSSLTTLHIQQNGHEILAVLKKRQEI